MAEKSAEASSNEGSSCPQDERPSGNWWDSWITSAKSKSAEVYTMVKKDLDEIGSAVKSEASHVFSSTSNVIGKTLKLENPESTANVMKKSLSTFIGQVSTVLNPEPDDDDDTEVILSSGDTTMLSTYKKELEALQRVDATFIVAAYSPEFEAWRASLESTQAIAPAAADKRLHTNPVLKAQYERLVPDAVAHDDFWERYLFRVALLQDRLAAASRKQPSDEPTTADPVMDHLPLQSQSNTPIQQSPKKILPVIESDKSYENSDIENAVVTWEDEDFANDVELTEEQQILLLEEYEKEISTKKTKSTRDTANNNVNQQTNTNKSTNKTKSAQTRDAMNNKQDKKITNKNAAQKKQQTIDNKNGGQKKTQQTIDNKNGGQQKTQENKNGGKKTVKSPKKQDVCGNDLVEDYFGENAKDEDSNSDESWEKEFEIEDVEQKA